MNGAMPSVHRLLQALLSRLAGVVCRHPWRILVVSLLVTAVSIVVATSRFKVINNVAQLLDEDSPSNRSYLELQREFGTDEVYLVLIQSDDVQKNREVAMEVGDFMRSLRPQISRVYCRMDFSKIEERFLFLAPMEDLREIEEQVRLGREAIQKTALPFDLNSTLDQANRSFDDKYLRQKENWKEFKPFVEQFKSVLNQVADQIEECASIKPRTKRRLAVAETAAAGWHGREIQSILEERRFVSFDEGRAVLVVGVRGEVESGGASPFAKTVEALRSFLAELSRRHPSVRLGLTGEPVLGHDELQTSTRDTELASVITAALIAILFFVAYRSLERPIWAGVVLGMAIAWTFAFTMLGIGHFNIISFAVIPMVLGLGIDFGIQILSRYEEALAAGRTVGEALGDALGVTGVAVVTAGTTTAAGFFTLCFNDFLGLRELGAIAGSSILFCLMANLVVLPAIFVIRDRRRSPEFLRSQAVNSWGFMAPLDRKMVRFPKAGVLVAILITAVAVQGIFKVRFDYNLLNLQNQKLESLKVLHELFRVSENSTLFASVVARDLAEARVLEKKLAALPSVAKVETITGLLPEDQEEKLPILRRISKSLEGMKLDTDVSDKVDVERARRDVRQFLDACRQAVKEARRFEKISGQAREAVRIFDGMIPPLERLQKAMGGLSQEELGRRLNASQIKVFGGMKRNMEWLKRQKVDRVIRMEDLPGDIAARFISPSGKILVQVYAKEDVWEREANRRFVTELRSVAPGVTGTPVQNFEYIELMKTSFIKASFWAFGIIALLLVLHFRTPVLVGLAIFPLVLAVIWRTGLMGWCDLPFNPANIVTMPLIIGVDVAYGVYIVERFREDGRISIFSTSTGKAIILTGLASLFGFVSLLVSRYEGMYSIGLLMSLGIVIGMFTTVVVLPQVLALIRPEGRGAPPGTKVAGFPRQARPVPVSPGLEPGGKQL